MRSRGLGSPALLALVAPLLLALSPVRAFESPSGLPAFDPLTGPRSPLRKDWIGMQALAPGAEILVMAGHADSQGLPGAGTSGAAVGLAGAAPMQGGINDELYWNLRTAHLVVEMGRRRGLPIRLYVPPFRTIRDGGDSRTNWSVGERHVRAGGYAMEIHYDAYGPEGPGSGVIPAIDRPFNRIDESLARSFGAYPWAYRGGLGGPRRGISLLEIGKLEGRLEASLRDPQSREATLNMIANRVVDALESGLRSRPDAVGSVPRGPGRPASSGDE
ncbi:MAG: dehydrogenase [Synechococcaceae cyanobacterium]|nr:dehydrogenase [Synechococcaceae cyanobacterium]